MYEYYGKLGQQIDASPAVLCPSFLFRLVTFVYLFKHKSNGKDGRKIKKAEKERGR